MNSKDKIESFFCILKPVGDCRSMPTQTRLTYKISDIRWSVRGCILLSLPPLRGSPISQFIRYVLLLTLPSVAPVVKLVIKALKGEGAIFCRWQKIVRNKKYANIVFAYFLWNRLILTPNL